MKKVKAPIFSKLISHYEKSPISFHIPGHKMGKGFNPIGVEYYSDILKIDMTEIAGFDDLHQSQGIILDAEKRAACLFGADKTFFLINGSTSGNLAMILATCRTGDKVIVQKNAHKSVINGILLARAIPLYLNPETIAELGIAGGLNEVNLINTLENNHDVKAVIITNPNYYGITMDLQKIINIVHKYHIPILVDEAHGAHFGLHSLFPKSAIQMGADIVVQSTHKTLSAMTMGSMLHVNNKYVDIDRLKFFLSMIQSSSPSYPIMASLDLTCDWIESKREQLWTDILLSINEFYQQAYELRNIKVIHHLKDKYKIDPLKIIIHSINKNFSGVKIQKLLEQKGIFTELADIFNTLAVVSIGTSKKDMKALLKSLIEIDQVVEISEGNQNEVIKHLENIYCSNIEGNEISLDRILSGDNKLVPINKAIGGIAAEMIIPYPPGIPLIQIGEKITNEHVEHLLKMKDLGIRVHGIYGTDFNKINIIKNSNILI